MSKAVIVIPARYGSSRLPGKPLLDIVGKPMIQHVYERALQVVGVAEVWVATDDQRVEKAVQAFGGKSIMTRNDHESGTDRLVEVMHKVEADININLQGDEPMIRPRDVGTLLQGMRDDPALPVATLCHAISAEEATEPSTVKVVVNTRQDALYFSRSPIPYPRNAEKARYLKHVGIYAYRRDVLQNYSQLPESMPEQAESLEQLRLMNAGINIRTFEITATGPGVDTPACLEKVRALRAQELAENA
ncbi:3-deoxy-manno-octulosonate cytidylyltransferase [Escherichia coli]|uniref:3-deoxy-manno-octulosonate cytidylyltransferase n=1 Tax=Escherichia coli TaxID=562 RepID=UPI001C7093FA|nr:3-deoxy-manno-octulosonate cytidylyltransferase [Escherichia coli]EIM8549027.1 3-deoxy-manno-octulosonate cytidylyltransferase [Escherichia coli]MBW9807626.1 3-deoxy-manno-octulosonate cytidylyltransferase [Escherichia coli]